MKVYFLVGLMVCGWACQSRPVIAENRGTTKNASVEVAQKSNSPQSMPTIVLNPLEPQGNPPLAKVGDRNILASEIISPLFFYRATQGRELLQKLVDDEMARLEANRHGIKVSDEDISVGVKQGMDTLAQQVNIEFKGARTLEDFLTNDYGISEASYRSGLRRFVHHRLLLERVLRFDQLLEERITCRLITVPSKALADEIVWKVNQGADFKVIAQRDSVAPSKEEGGKLPPFGPFSTSAITGPVFQAQVGDVVGPIEEVKGKEKYFHVVKVLEKIPARPVTFEEVEGEILRGIQETPIGEWEYLYWTQKMQARYKVELFSPL